ncbi:MAG: hypothetical protein AB8G05_14170 [Oligoflexales bacterium]
MEEMVKMNWERVISYADAYQLFSQGNLPIDKEVIKAFKTLENDNKEPFYQFYVDAILQKEKENTWKSYVMESCLQMAHYRLDEKQVIKLIELFWKKDDPLMVCQLFTESMIAWEKNLEIKEEHVLFPFAVTLTCEFGIYFATEMHKRKYNDKDIQKILAPIASYLISLANINDSGVRLALLRYFAILASVQSDRTDFIRIMNRFGHSVLLNLLNRLSDKKVAAYATSYLLENFHLFFVLDEKNQLIVHESLKNYMLKEPEILTSLLKKLAKQLKRTKKDQPSRYVKIFESHLGALLSVAAELSRKSLAWGLLAVIEEFSSLKVRNEYIKAVINKKLGSAQFHSFLRELSKSSCRTKAGQKLLFDSCKSKKTAIINLIELSNN